MADGGRDIPEHVLFYILAWLPVVSLLRFKCVCKSWCALFESSDFIAQHLHRSNSSEDVLIASGHEHSTNNDFHMLIYGNEYKKSSNLDYMHAFITRKEKLYYMMVGSCNGIVCAGTSRYGEYTLCNPAMKQKKRLPEPSFPTAPIETYYQYAAVGFGFNVKTNDYKVIRVLFYDDGSSSAIYKIVEVYSKSVDSWRTLHKEGASLPFEKLNQFPQATNKNGTCFWTAISFDLNGTCSSKLVSFDLNDEVFGSMSLPKGNLCDKECGLDFLNDNLVYIKGVESDMSDRGHRAFEIWMLHEFGVEESWNKIYKIRPVYSYNEGRIDDEYYLPIRLSKNGEFVVLLHYYDDIVRQRGELRLYDLRIGDNNWPLILPPDCLVNHLFHYNESLVSIKS